jgi:spoIIIJ-associated protein
MEEKKLKLVEGVLREILDNLRIKADFKLEEKQGAVFVSIETPTPGILIGYHGRTIAALQRILSLIVYRRLKEWLKIVVDVGGYRQKREEVLKRMALSLAQKVKFSGQEQELPPMSSPERRIIHLALSGDSEITTESRGEGKERRVVIKPKK